MHVHKPRRKVRMHNIACTCVRRCAFASIHVYATMLRGVGRSVDSHKPACTVTVHTWVSGRVCAHTCARTRACASICVAARTRTRTRTRAIFALVLACVNFCVCTPVDAYTLCARVSICVYVCVLACILFSLVLILYLGAVAVAVLVDAHGHITEVRNLRSAKESKRKPMRIHPSNFARTFMVATTEKSIPFLGACCCHRRKRRHCRAGCHGACLRPAFLIMILSKPPPPTRPSPHSSHHSAIARLRTVLDRLESISEKNCDQMQVGRGNVPKPGRKHTTAQKQRQSR